MRCQNPLVKRNFGALKQGSNSDGELLAAIAFIAEIEASTAPFDLGRMIALATMRADRAISPKQGFEMFAGFVGIVIDGV